MPHVRWCPNILKCVITVVLLVVIFWGYVCLPLWTASAVLSKILLKINNLFLICQNLIWKVNKMISQQSISKKTFWTSGESHKPENIERVPSNSPNLGQFWPILAQKWVKLTQGHLWTTGRSTLNNKWLYLLFWTRTWKLYRFFLSVLYSFLLPCLQQPFCIFLLPILDP